MYLSFDSNGLIQLNPEDTLANQQPTQSANSNSTETLNGGWPAYEFGDDYVFRYRAQRQWCFVAYSNVAEHSQ